LVCGASIRNTRRRASRASENVERSRGFDRRRRFEARELTKVEVADLVTAGDGTFTAVTVH